MTGGGAKRINPEAAKNRAALRKARARKQLNRRGKVSDPKELAAYAEELEARKRSSAPTKGPPPTPYVGNRPGDRPIWG